MKFFNKSIVALLATAVAVTNVAAMQKVGENRFQVINTETGEKHGPLITIVNNPNDITQQKFDYPEHAAIVNAANSAMRGGGGVDGAIHRAAGGQLLQHEQNYNLTCSTGESVYTPAFDLATKGVCAHIIHTVGPQGTTQNRSKLLSNAYRNSLELAATKSIHYIAFPAISTGIFGYPLAEAVGIVRQTVIDFVNQNPSSGITEIRFVIFDAKTQAAYDHYFNQ